MHTTRWSIENKMRKHQERVRNAKAIIDVAPPKLQPNTFVGINRLPQDAKTNKTRMKHNLELLQNINVISRGHGKVDTFPSRSYSTDARSRVLYKISQANRIQKQNEQLGTRIQHTKAGLPSRAVRPSQRCSITVPFAKPTAVLSKYKNLKLPEDDFEQMRLLRPLIFFDIEIKDARPIGRIVIQLFTEASPQVVLEFMRMCSQNDCDRLQFVRLFPTLWMEGDLKVRPSDRIHYQHEYDMRALDNDSAAGILTYSKASLQGKGYRPGFFNFAISFKPLRVVNGHRIAFGRILKGLKYLPAIQSYGSKNGKPVKEITLKKCGIMQMERRGADAATYHSKLSNTKF